MLKKMKLNSKDVYLNYAAVVKVESRKEFSRRIENPRRLLLLFCWDWSNIGTTSQICGWTLDKERSTGNCIKCLVLLFHYFYALSEFI